MKANILVTRKIFPEALAYLEENTNYVLGSSQETFSREELLHHIRDKEGLLCLLLDKIDEAVMEAAPRLKIIANCAAGTDNIDCDAARNRGILVTNTPGVLTEATADLTWALILAVARRIPQAEKFLREGNFKGWTIDGCLGKDIFGKRLGIIGMGRIGQAVALRGRAFHTETVYIDPHPLSSDEERRYGVRFLPLDELLRSSDIVTIHASLNETTQGLLSRERIALMKKDAILINVARGPIVDEAALAEALEKRRLWGAGLDVYEKEPQVENALLQLENVVLVPHIGSATFETRLKMCMMAARNLVQGLKGDRPDNLVV